MSGNSKTSTFTIHHDRCDPKSWTLGQWKLLQEFIEEPLLQRAAALSMLGIQLVLSEHHEPKGGKLEQVGYGLEDQLPSPLISDDLAEVVDDDLEVTPVVPIYRGPTQYVVKFGTATCDGEYDGTEHQLFDTEAEADAFLKSLHQTEPA